MKRQKDMTQKGELHRSVDTQYTAEEEQRNSSRKNGEAESKWKQCPDVDVSGGESKAQNCKKQLRIVTWNVKSMNQGKLELTKQEIAGVNIDILGIIELKCMGISKFNSDDHCI